MKVKDQLILLIIIRWYIRRRSSTRIPRIRDNTSALSGHAYTQELLGGSNTQCQELIRMSRDAYIQLCNHFKERSWLHDSRYVSVEEKIAIFLTIIGHNERFRMIKRRFQHSTQTIHSCFHEVLHAMMEFSRKVVASTSFDTTSNSFERYNTLRQIFPICFTYKFSTLSNNLIYFLFL